MIIRAMIERVNVNTILNAVLIPVMICCPILFLFFLFSYTYVGFPFLSGFTCIIILFSLFVHNSMAAQTDQVR